MTTNFDNGNAENKEADHIDDMLKEEEDREKAKEEKVSELTEEMILKKELDDARRKLAEAEEKVLRVAADAENTRKRLVKDTDDKIKYANQSIIAKFLPVLDNFDLALTHAEGLPEKVIEGLRLTQKSLTDTLEKEGFKKIEAAAGEVFDPMVHEAVMLASDENYDDNTITMVLQNGYTQHGRVLRPAKVQVNKLN